jgi:hypothetical protein
VHRARPLSDPHRPQRAEDDTSDTANPHHALRSFRATRARLEAPHRYIRISVENRLPMRLKLGVNFLFLASGRPSIAGHQGRSVSPAIPLRAWR